MGNAFFSREKGLVEDFAGISACKMTRLGGRVEHLTGSRAVNKKIVYGLVGDRFRGNVRRLGEHGHHCFAIGNSKGFSLFDIKSALVISGSE